MQTTYFQYGEKEIEYLKNKDKKLAFVINKIGHIKREAGGELFPSLVQSIIAQQISTKALQSIWQKMVNSLGIISPGTISNLTREEIQKFGISFKKADYILEFALKVKNGNINLDELSKTTEEEFIKELTTIRGIGVWTAEMALLFCLQRPNILSYNDLGIQKGLRMIYRHKKITKQLFEKYKKRFSPYCSIASLYLWEISGGAIKEFSDPLVTVKKIKKKI